MSRAVILLSGGLDSCTALALAANEHQNLYAVSFRYGQRHSLELAKARDIADHYGVDQHVILDVPLFSGESVLMDESADMPEMTYEEIEKSEGVSPTYVPFRNGTFLSLAASLALDRGCSMIYAGMHGEDARGWAYPDCTPEFVGAMQNAIYVGTYYKVRLVVPFQYMLKKEIVAVGLALRAPYDLTLSCYKGQEPACGKCSTCVGRLEAFRANGANDPIPYAVDVQGRLL